jgi:hypothetical protein
VAKSEFDLLYTQAIEVAKAFPEYQFKTVAAMSIIIGWLITSEGAQKFIKVHASVTLPGAMLAFGLLIGLKFIWILGHQRRMNHMYARLVKLAATEGVSPSALDFIPLGKLLPATYIIVNVVLSVVGMVIVWLICRQ